MPKKSGPGALPVPVTCVLKTQQQVFLVLSKLDGLGEDQRETLLTALATGDEEYYPRQAFQNGWFKKETKSRAAVMKRFAESYTLDRMLEILEQEDGAVYKEVVLPKLLHSREWAFKALRQNAIAWSKEESAKLMDVVLPGITGNESGALLYSPHACNSKPEYRLILVLSLERPLHVIPYILKIDGQPSEKNEPYGGPLTKKERGHLIALCAKDSSYAYDLLFPDSFQKRNGFSFEKAEYIPLHKSERKLLAEKAGHYICNQLQFASRRSDIEHYAEEAEQLLKEFEATLSKELQARLKEYIKKLQAAS